MGGEKLMDYETGKNFEAHQERIETLEKAVNYLLDKFGVKATVKKPVEVVEKPVPKEVVEEPVEETTREVEEEAPEDEVIEEIVEQEHEEPTVKPKKKRLWGKKQPNVEEEEPVRML